MALLTLMLVAALLPHGRLAAQVPAPETPPSVPKVEDPALAKPAAVMATHCARCHQVGRADGAATAAAAGGGVAALLDLADAARDPSLIVPGVPEASALYQQLLGHRLPSGADWSSWQRPQPTADEAIAVRDWIAGLPARRAACPAAQAATREAVLDAVRQAIARLTVAELRDTRFVSLAPLIRACAPPSAIAAARQGVVKLLNALSWQPRTFSLDSSGPDGLLIVVQLSTLGWVEAHWEQIAASYPYAGLPAEAIPEEIVAATGTAAPVLPGDWLAAAATSPGLYATLLGLPDTLSDLERILGVDREAAYKRRSVRRAASRASAVTRHNRLVEFLALPIGGLWRTAEFAGSEPDDDLFLHPFDDALRLDGGSQAHEADAARVLFNLPNALPAFAVFDGDGARLAQVPAGIDRDRAPTAAGRPAGLACLACHGTGPIGLADELRAAAAAAGPGVTESRAERAAIAALHPPAAEQRKLVEGEVLRVRRALVQAGIDPDATLDGHEPVTGLARRHMRPVDLETASVEIGLSTEELLERIARLEGRQRRSGLRLAQGLLPREETAALYHAIAGSAPRPAALPPPAGGGETAPEAPPAKGLEILVDAPGYQVGDLVTIAARSAEPCNLTLVSLDARGKATVLLPNDYEQDNRLMPGNVLRVPGPKAPYQFRVLTPGTEMLIGICTTVSPIAKGIEPDYERQLFTLLGDWRNHTYSALAAQDEARKAGDKPAAVKGSQRGSAQPRGRNGQRPVHGPAVDGPRVPETQHWATAVYQVR